MDCHKGALKATRHFWRQLVRRDVSFGDLTRTFVAMESAEKRADSTFKMVGGWAGLWVGGCQWEGDRAPGWVGGCQCVGGQADGHACGWASPCLVARRCSTFCHSFPMLGPRGWVGGQCYYPLCWAAAAGAPPPDPLHRCISHPFS